MHIDVEQQVGSYMYLLRCYNKENHAFLKYIMSAVKVLHFALFISVLFLLLGCKQPIPCSAHMFQSSKINTQNKIHKKVINKMTAKYQYFEYLNKNANK